MSLQESKKAYTSIFKLLKKHKDVCNFDMNHLEDNAKYHLFGLELNEKYGININPKSVSSLNYINYGDIGYIAKFGENYKRYISWPDGGVQPEDELLFCLTFSSGAYTFGDDYAVVLFQNFFLELKSYNPKYTDSHNHSLYYSLDNTKAVYDNFDSIFKKYKEIHKNESNERRIMEIKNELLKLENKI